jgi:hypothetical protein
MDDVLKLLINADTAMVAVTFAVCQVAKRMLPSPPPEIPGGVYNPWSTIKRFEWVPFALAFVIGVSLSMAFDQHVGQSLVGKARDGLQTGAYSVVTWELWSNIKKLFGEK